MAGELDIPREVERRLIPARERLEQERRELRPQVREELEAEMDARWVALDVREQALHIDRDHLRQEQGELAVQRHALRRAQDELRRQGDELARRLRQAATDARANAKAAAEVALRTITGVILERTRPTGEGTFEVPGGDAKIIERLDLGPLLADAVGRVARFWREVRGQLDEQGLEHARDAAREADAPDMKGPEP